MAKAKEEIEKVTQQRKNLLAYKPKNGLDALDHVINNFGKRVPKYENLIASDPESAYKYASIVVRGPWPEGEPAIITDPYWSFCYAHEVIKGQWPPGEPAISLEPYSSFQYAWRVLESRFPAGEREICRSYTFRDDYLRMFPDAKDDWMANGWLDWLYDVGADDGKI